MSLIRWAVASAFFLALAPAAQAVTFKVARTLSLPTAADFRGCNTDITHLNDRGEVASGCAHQVVKFGLNPATLLFGFYGVERNKLLFWGATATSAKVVSNPSGRSADSLWVSGLTNAGQALVYAGQGANYMWRSSGWQAIKFSGAQQVRSLAPTGEVLGDVYGKQLEYWRDGVLTPMAIPEGYFSVLGLAPNGPLFLASEADYNQLYVWRSGSAPQTLPIPEGRARESLLASNAAGQFVLTTTDPATAPNAPLYERERQLHVFDGQRFLTLPDKGPGDINLRKLAANGQVLAQQVPLGSAQGDDWLLANGQWTSLRNAITLPAGTVYDQAITINGLGHVLIQARRGTRTVWLVCLPQ